MPKRKMNNEILVIFYMVITIFFATNDALVKHIYQVLMNAQFSNQIIFKRNLLSNIYRIFLSIKPI